MGVTRDFKGVWIPKEIWLNELLTLMEKVFLVEINSLDNENGCFASNDHFAKFFAISKPRCTQVIKSLKDKEFISVEYSYRAGSKEVEKRTLKVCSKFSYGGDKFPYGGDKKAIRGDKKTIKRVIHPNNTVSNTSKRKGSAGTSSDEKKFINKCFTACIEVWKRHHKDWIIENKDGAGIKGIVDKLNAWQNDGDNEITPETTASAFDYILSHQSVKGNNFLATADPMVLNSKLNSIYEQIKNGGNGAKQFFSKTRASDYDTYRE